MRVGLGILIALVSLAGHAHEVRPAFLRLTEVEPGSFEVLWKQPVLGDRRLALEPLLPADCTVVAETTPEHTGAALMQRWRVACALDNGTIHIRGLSRTLTDVLVQIDRLEKPRTIQLLRAGSPTLDLESPTPAASGFLMLGVEHLLSGVDHLLFIMGLVLFVRAPWLLVKTVTAFTLAHSITLTFSVLELVRLPQQPVEAVIALSILFLARELVVPEQRRSRLTMAKPWLMAFAFGLLHGFGFAGALIDIGLPKEQLGLSLLLFNLGIELGQLAVVAIMLTVGAIGRHLLSAYRKVLEGGFAWIMGSAAAFWTIDRVLIAL
ncbi:MAG: HupE/UreJ family protein [Gammaproteobacteria bacterium]|nr:HupE/UreJ family protein [Gammaproteobacteria bacterium]